MVIYAHPRAWDDMHTPSKQNGSSSPEQDAKVHLPHSQSDNSAKCECPRFDIDKSRGCLAKRAAEDAGRLSGMRKPPYRTVGSAVGQFDCAYHGSGNVGVETYERSVPHGQHDGILSRL